MTLTNVARICGSPVQNYHPQCGLTHVAYSVTGCFYFHYLSPVIMATVTIKLRIKPIVASLPEFRIIDYSLA